MDKAAFEAGLARDGFNEVVTKSVEAGFANTEHFHGWDARLLITAGEFRVTRNGGTDCFMPGDSCEVPAGSLHSESTGPAGASYIAGRRY